MKKILNKGPVTDTNCACSKSEAENDYVSILELFINKLYPEHNRGFFNLSAREAEETVCKDMEYLGYNTNMVNKAFVDTVNNFKSKHTSVLLRLDSFVNTMLEIPHKEYNNYYVTNFRMILTLILGFLGKLNSVDIITCHDPKQYFRDRVNKTFVPDLSAAVNKTRAYVKESKDNWLAEGMRMVEQWFDDIAKENIPPKELTVADIEKQLGYKIKIVGEDK